MHKVPAWKWLLLLVIIALAMWSLYPPQKKLKPGLDLVGGTTLIYEVQIEPGITNPQRVLEDTIAVLRERVDPNGVRNLIWRVQGANRIEIQMPLAPAQTTKLRQAYVEARDALLSGNIPERRLDAALRAEPAQREATLAQLSGDDATMRVQLDEMVAAYDAMLTVREPYETAQTQLRTAQEALSKLPQDAPAEQKKEMQEHVDSLLQQLIPQAQKYNEARKAVDASKQKVLTGNIEPARLEAVLSTYDPTKPKALEAYRLALTTLTEKTPQRAEQIKQVAAAYEAYSVVKGPLDDPNDLIAMLKGSGVLEFRVTAPASLPEAQEFLTQLKERGPRAGGDKPWRWFAIDNPERFAGDDRRDYQALQDTPEQYFARRGMIGTEYAGNYFVLLGNRQESAIRQEDGGWALTQVYPTRDDMHYNAIGFALNAVGGQLMSSLTAGHMHEPMAILLDGRVLSAPTIQARIGDSGIITGGSGGFSQREMQYMLNTLGAGSTQAELSDAPVSMKTTGPQLGQDNLEHGLKAAISALIIVSAFMMVYYFYWGAIANFALYSNLLLMLAVMASIQATFTLPGIAGIVLTIGMAVDANVLIFERIREEMERKADLSTSVRLGYQKALSTIIDSNLTTLITCLILGYTASADVKGFAVTLGIGLVANILTAVIWARWLTDMTIQWFRPRHLPMLALVVPAVRRLLTPNIDWVGKRYAFMTLSVVLVVAGLVGIAMRGADFFDIEFRGGTQVSFELAGGKTMTVQDVRDRLTRVADEAGLPELAGQRATVVTMGEAQGTTASAFSIVTLESELEQVSDAIKKAFADVLETTQPITLADADQEVAQAPVYALRSATLGDSIGRSATDDVSDYVGGVAIVLEGLEPATTVADVTQRINRMRMLPTYESLGTRQAMVIGLTQAPEASITGEPQYASVAVLVRDAAYNYADAPDALREPGGLADTEWKLVRDALARDTSLAGVNNVSSQVSDTMKQQAIAALCLSWLAILVYIWFRFGGFIYGLGAILSLIHDVIVSVGLAALAFWVYDTWIGHALLLSPFRVDLAMVAAILTLIGYSVNDTIVIYDRIRENRGRLAVATPGIINDSINQTISRTILTAGTTLVAVLLLYIMGGPGVHGFAFIMLVGSVVGCYSTIAVASPLLLVIGRVMERRAATTGKPTPATST